ncbi:MAG: NupC/NupG family nucleoside CNT transporter [Firmicutes bacterium]|nr:NupC/NupG family nucleoside CNT transporter [Bacillota bacterium]
MVSRLPALLGFIIILGIAILISNNKKAINYRTVFWGISLQFVLALLVLKGALIQEWLYQNIPFLNFRLRYYALFVGAQIFILVFWGKAIYEAIPRRAVNWVAGLQVLFVIIKFNLLEKFFNGARNVVSGIIDYTNEGATFVFGKLAAETPSIGMVFAFKVLPTIIFIASIFAILYYYGIMQAIVRYFAKLMVRFLGTSGAESTSVAASIFMGQTEAPLTIRPFLQNMTLSELMTIMTAGMAHVSGGIMAAYVLVAHVDIKHLLMAVIMTAPGAILMAKIMVPEVETPKTGSDVRVEVPKMDVNVIDAAARGATEGGHLCLNVMGMLIAFISLIALINGLFGTVHNALFWLSSHTGAGFFNNIFTGLAGVFPESLQKLLGWIFAPLAWAMGVPWHDATQVGNLMGIRMVLNEFVAFMQLGPMKETLDPRSFIIATYALCGFANFSSIAIQIGGIGALAPNRRHDLAKLGLRAMLAGTLANFMTATIAGILL